MEKKKILIISYSYPPSNVPAAQRPYAVAKYLDKSKFDITIITCGNPDLFWGVNKGFNPELQEVKLLKIDSLLSPSSYSFMRDKSSMNKRSLLWIKSFFTKSSCFFDN